nr:hypothetical protein [Pedobacter panaciterrae]
MNNDWLDIAVLEDYLDGKLDAKTMNRVEREALEDPFVAEALAGLSLSPKRSLESLSLLQKQLHERVAEHHSAKKATVITWQRLSIAAAAAVIFISVGIIFWMKQVNYQEMASKRPKNILINIAPKEDSDSAIKNADAVASLKTERTDKASVEIDKAIKAAKTDSYASNSKPKSKSAINSKEVESIAQANVSAAPASAARVLNDSSANLNEVVVAAYAKKAVTGAPGVRGTVSVRGLTSVKPDYDNPAAVRFTIDSKDINDVPVANVNQLIQGVSTGVSKTPFPTIGWSKFNSYLTENNSYITEAKKGQSAEFRFEFKDFRPINVVVVRGFSEEFNEEVIRLIQTGPDWDVQEAAHPIVFLTVKY